MKYDASTGEMCFANALQAIERGHKLYRAGWRTTGVYVFIPRHMSFIAISSAGSDSYYRKWTPDSEDLLAKDWLEKV